MSRRGNPQLEDGHTRIANELLEALTGYPFGGGELRVVLAIIRLTYGWNRKRCVLRQTTMARLTRLDRRQIQRVLTALRQQGVLLRDRTTRPFTYQLNKAYHGWRDWPAGELPDNVVRFMEAANQGSMPGCELSPEPDTLAAAAPDTCVRVVKDIKTNIKDRECDAAVHNLSRHFSRLLQRPLTSDEEALVLQLHNLSPAQAQQLLQQVAARCHAPPPEGGTHVHGADHPGG